MRRRLKTIAVDVYVTPGMTMIPVGRLEKKENYFVFVYHARYLKLPWSIPLGPEFPLTQEEFRSEELFPTFEDRIPLRRNPAYPDYCWQMGISVDEEDPLTLLASIGSRGPSSFVFVPVYERSFGVHDVSQYRKLLQLTTREFCHLFEIAQSSLHFIEKGDKVGKDVLKRLELIVRFPEVAWHQYYLNGAALPLAKRKHVVSILQTLSHDYCTHP